MRVLHAGVWLGVVATGANNVATIRFVPPVYSEVPHVLGLGLWSVAVLMVAGCCAGVLTSIACVAIICL
jgi:hypothetical protein